MYKQIKDRISAKCLDLQRDEPKLIAVSKMQPLERVEAVINEDVRVFGENRVQEAQGKWPNFSNKYGKFELHLLGPLQSNKAHAAFELFDVIHSLDRLKLAKKFADLAQTQGRCPELFIQINIGEEAQKSGISPSDFSNFLKDIKSFNLPVLGLMCIPPAGQDPRPYFQNLRQMAQDHNLEGLSMGMSGDFEIAIEEGATHIRVGSAIFGARD